MITPTGKDSNPDIRISITSSAGGNSPEQALKRLKEAGFHYAELSIEHTETIYLRGEAAWRKFRELADQAGIRFLQAHLPQRNSLCTEDEELRQTRLENLRNYCVMYHVLGITAAVVHCGGDFALAHGEDPATVRKRRVRSLLELLRDLPEGMTLCLENLPGDTFEDVEANLIECGNPENLGYCLDTGHLHITPPANQGDYIRKAGKKLKAIHIHDNVGPLFSGPVRQAYWDTSDKHLFPGFFYGSINWNTVLTALREVGYSGLWNLEIAADYGSGIPPYGYRELVLRQHRERAEFLFHYDPEAPVPGDPVNDFSRFQPISRKDLKLTFRRWKIHAEFSRYQVTADPVHGGRLASWKIDGREILFPNSSFGWGIAGVWMPRNLARLWQFGMAVDEIEENDGSIRMKLSGTVKKEFEFLADLPLVLIRQFFPDAVRTELQLKNIHPEKMPSFAVRFHCMTALTGGGSLPRGAVTFSDGTTLPRDEKGWIFLLPGAAENLADCVSTAGHTVPIPAADFTIGMPGSPEPLRITFPGKQPAAVYFEDTTSGVMTMEPIFQVPPLEPGEVFTAVMQADIPELR